MDRLTGAAYRLWGSLDEQGHLHGSPLFAAELDAECKGELGLRVERVSKWSFGEHLEHLYLTSHYELDRLEEAMARRNISERIGIYGVGLMTAGFIPRGVFRTIPPLVPKSGTMDSIAPLRESLKARLDNLEWDLRQIKESQGRSRHPRMKYMLARQWLVFADIHHRHHLAIMRDILKVAS